MQSAQTLACSIVATGQSGVVKQPPLPKQRRDRSPRAGPHLLPRDPCDAFVAIFPIGVGRGRSGEQGKQAAKQGEQMIWHGQGLAETSACRPAPARSSAILGWTRVHYDKAGAIT